MYRGKWAAVWREGGKTRRVSLGTSDRGEAERRLRDLRTQPAGTTVAAFVAAYLKAKSEARSHEAMRYAWKALRPTFGDLRPDQIDAALCSAYAGRRKRQGVKDGTVLKELSFLRTALRGEIKKGQFKMPAQPAPRDRHLTRKEFDALLKAATLPHIRLFIILALTTAARAGALLQLTWDQIDFERGRIILGKGEQRRKGRATVPMNDRARKALEEAFEARTSEYVIEWAGKPLGSIKRAFRLAADKAKLKDVTPHVLRHTAAVWAIEAGRSMEEVAQYLGHTDSRLTYRVYARYSPEHLKGVAKALE